MNGGESPAAWEREVMLFRRGLGLAPLRFAGAYLRCDRPNRPDEDISNVVPQIDALNIDTCRPAL